MKENITIEQAEKLLRERVGKIHIEDAAHEWVHETICDRIEEIEEEYNVLDADGEPCTSDTTCEVCWYDEAREELMRSFLERIGELFAERIGTPKTDTTEKVWIVLKNEVWDGETLDIVIGTYRNEADAEIALQREKDKIRKDWEDETIDEDTPKSFYAYREGEYMEYHVNLYMEHVEIQ